MQLRYYVSLAWSLSSQAFIQLNAGQLTILPNLFDPLLFHVVAYLNQLEMFRATN